MTEKLAPDDLGQTEIRMFVKNNKVVMAFPKPITWVGFDKKLAIEFAKEMLKRAVELS